MQPLFPPWSDTIFRLCLAIAVLGIVSIPVSMILWVRTPYVTKEDDLLDAGATEQDDFDPALDEWEGVTSENFGGADEPER